LKRSHHFFIIISTYTQERMDETVAYMMMPGGGEEEAEVGEVQPTQLVALQTEDGTQQLAVPIIDPATGQVSTDSRLRHSS
jgi:hypothetical protein